MTLMWTMWRGRRAGWTKLEELVEEAFFFLLYLGSRTAPFFGASASKGIAASATSQLGEKDNKVQPGKAASSRNSAAANRPRKAPRARGTGEPGHRSCRQPGRFGWSSTSADILDGYPICTFSVFFFISNG